MIYTLFLWLLLSAASLMTTPAVAAGVDRENEVKAILQKMSSGEQNLIRSLPLPISGQCYLFAKPCHPRTLWKVAWFALHQMTQFHIFTNNNANPNSLDTLATNPWN